MENESSRIIKTLAALAIATTVIGSGFLVLLDYLNLPVIAFNQGEECVWVEIIDGNGVERRACPVDLPDRYIKEYVWFDDSKGNSYE